MAEPIPLFPDAPAAPRKPRLEVHEHHIIRGPRAHRTGAWPAGQGSSFEHSHDGGDVPHGHPDTGPAAYTIDKDDWYQRTGLKGGGRKKFTKAPTGEQFEFIARPPEDGAFEVIVCDPPAPPGFTGEGGGIYAAQRMVLAFGLRAEVKAAPTTPSTRKEA